MKWSSGRAYATLYARLRITGRLCCTNRAGQATRAGGAVGAFSLTCSRAAQNNVTFASTISTRVHGKHTGANAFTLCQRRGRARRNNGNGRRQADCCQATWRWRARTCILGGRQALEQARAAAKTTYLELSTLPRTSFLRRRAANCWDGRDDRLLSVSACNLNKTARWRTLGFRQRAGWRIVRLC